MESHRVSYAVSMKRLRETLWRWMNVVELKLMRDTTEVVWLEDKVAGGLGNQAVLEGVCFPWRSRLTA